MFRANIQPPRQWRANFRPDKSRSIMPTWIWPPRSGDTSSRVTVVNGEKLRSAIFSKLRRSLAFVGPSDELAAGLSPLKHKVIKLGHPIRLNESEPKAWMKVT